MNRLATACLLALITGWSATAPGADYYVDRDNATGATPPFDTWAKAATNIQDAVDAASDDDTILVAAGTYELPANPVAYDGTLNVVDIRKALTVRGSSGTPADTIIDGQGTYRGMYLSPPTGTTLLMDGFTVSNGWATDGGGMYLYGNNGGTTVVQNCVLKENTATSTGGGVTIGPAAIRTSYTILSNCVMQGNQVTNGTGAALASRVQGSATAIITHSSIVSNQNDANGSWSGASGFHFSPAPANTWIQNCEIAYNDEIGGGRSVIFVNGGAPTFRNSLIHHNTSIGAMPAAIYINGNNAGARLQNCTIASNTGEGLRFWNGTGHSLHVVNALFYAGGAAYGTGAFTTFTNCLVPTSQSITNGANNIFSNEPLFVDEAAHNLHLLRWSPAVDAGANQAWMAGAEDLDGNARISANGLVDIGAYETSFTAAPDHYVAQDGQTPQVPYTNWFTAASNIQEAVDTYAISDYGSNVWVAPGTYMLPTNPVVYDSVTNVLDVRVQVNLRGTSGNPADTIIDGEGQHRGAFLYPPAGGTILMDGFTIRNGWALQGGGMYLIGYNSRTTIVQNCAIKNNVAANAGGGVMMGPDATQSPYIVLSNCVIQANQVTNGTGAAMYTQVRNGSPTLILSDCSIVSNTCPVNSWSATPGIYFGPAPATTLIENCEFAYNVNPVNGRPAAMWLTGSVTARNSLFHHNDGNGYNPAVFFVRGSSHLILENCTVYDNDCLDVNVYNDNSALTFNNTIIYYNGHSFSAAVREAYTNCSLPTSFTVTNGTGNLFTDDPQLLDIANENYRLSPASPCLNRGLNQDWMIGAVDLDGNARIDSGVVDIGAYERPTLGTIIMIQ